MFTYTMTTFLVRCEMATDPKYPNEEYLQYLTPFGSIEFESPVEIWSVYVELTIPSKNRVCNVYCYDKSIDDMNPDAPFPTPIGRLQLTLWRNSGWREDGPEIITYFDCERTITTYSSNQYSDLGKMQTTFESKDKISHDTSQASTPTYSTTKTKSEKSVLFGLFGLLIAMAIGIAIFMNSGNKPAPPVATACVGKECNLRSSPAKGKNIIKTIPKGGTVAIIENVGEWSKVRYANSEGFIKSSLLTTSGK